MDDRALAIQGLQNLKRIRYYPFSMANLTMGLSQVGGMKSQGQGNEVAFALC
jgi:hypothetical protein